MCAARGRCSLGDEPVPGYRLIQFLGKGQFGDVWKAVGPGNNEVALKIIDLVGGEGHRELTALQQIKSIHHPNLVPVFASWLKDTDGQAIEEGQTDRKPTELIVAMGLGSKSLFDRLAECTAEGQVGIPRDELLNYMDDSARGIDYLNQPVHDLGEGPVPIIHGDIKPHNLLIVGNAVQICDFGLARAVETLRMTQTALGTCAYASAELLYGKPHRASDQYCLAVSYTELRSGELPFSETNPFQVADRHREGKLDFSKLPPREADVIRIATALSPDERWPSCCDMVRALRRACEADDAGEAPPAGSGVIPKEPQTAAGSARDRESDLLATPSSASAVQGTLLPPTGEPSKERNTDASEWSTQNAPVRLLVDDLRRKTAVCAPATGLGMSAPGCRRRSWHWG